MPKDDRSVTVAMPKGSNVWGFSAPYTLKQNWPKLNVSVSAADREYLFDSNTFREDPLIFHLSDDGSVENVHIDPYFRISPRAFTVRSGQSIRLTRQEGGPFILVEKTTAGGE
jgi:hypothetical protein